MATASGNLGVILQENGAGTLAEVKERQGRAGRASDLTREWENYGTRTTDRTY